LAGFLVRLLDHPFQFTSVAPMGTQNKVA
jgi:hypothetical protein